MNQFIETTPERPRVLYVATDGLTADVLLAGQLSAFVARGFEVAVAAAPGDGLDRAAAREGVRSFAIPFEREISPLRDALALRRLLSCLREFRPHLVNAGTPKAGLLGLMAARILRVPSRLYLLRGLRLETTRGIKRAVLRACERLAVQSAHRVVCVSRSLRQAAIAEASVDHEKLIVLGAGSSNGVDCARFATSARREADARALRRVWSIPPDAPVVGFVGRLTRDKGIADLAEAFAELAKESSNAHLVLIGREEAGDPVGQAALRQLRRHPRVRFIGHRRDLEACYRTFDVLAFPSYREGLPNVPLEAAASGLPVVAYAATGTVDVVKSGTTGVLVRVGDRTALRLALLAYLANPQRCASHGLAGRTFVQKHFSQDLVWQHWDELYRDELRRIGGPPPVTGMAASRNPDGSSEGAAA